MKYNVQAAYQAVRTQAVAAVLSLPESERGDMPATPEAFDEAFQKLPRADQARTLQRMVNEVHAQTLEARRAARKALRKGPPRKVRHGHDCADC
jgi:hypothetical protein